MDFWRWSSSTFCSKQGQLWTCMRLLMAFPGLIWILKDRDSSEQPVLIFNHSHCEQFFFTSFLMEFTMLPFVSTVLCPSIAHLQEERGFVFSLFFLYITSLVVVEEGRKTSFLSSLLKGFLLFCRCHALLPTNLGIFPLDSPVPHVCLYWGSQLWTQYFKWNLQSTKQREQSPPACWLHLC